MDFPSVASLAADLNTSENKAKRTPNATSAPSVRLFDLSKYLLQRQDHQQNGKDRSKGERLEVECSRGFGRDYSGDNYLNKRNTREVTWTLQRFRPKGS